MTCSPLDSVIVPRGAASAGMTDSPYSAHVSSRASSWQRSGTSADVSPSTVTEHGMMALRGFGRGIHAPALKITRWMRVTLEPGADSDGQLVHRLGAVLMAVQTKTQHRTA